ncbi:hypothetical protein YYG_04360 [Plasmodium vinckei petteri]|uniref:mRNA-decapping enzyme subunit 1 n=2 Tax=Plasmodium vinckei petteri TaxID=138298 RepID=W7AY57_PLAVN|nr:hypothetical protein YYG_04360 [Plasmodium vinckei petteri]
MKKKNNIPTNHGKMKNAMSRYDMNCSYNYNEHKSNNKGGKNSITTGDMSNYKAYDSGGGYNNNSAYIHGSMINNNNYHYSYNLKHNKNSYIYDYNSYASRKMYEYKDKHKGQTNGINTKSANNNDINNSSTNEATQKLNDGISKTNKEIGNNVQKEDKKKDGTVSTKEENKNGSSGIIPDNISMNNLENKKKDENISEEMSLLREKICFKMLKSIDIYITEIIMKSCFVTVYKMNENELKWKRADIEGFLYIVKRSLKPFYRLIITNKKNENHLLEDINSNMNLSTDQNYIFYKILNEENKSKSIYSLWFYSTEEKEKIYSVLKNIVGNISKEQKGKKNKQSYTNSEQYISTTNEDNAMTSVSRNSIANYNKSVNFILSKGDNNTVNNAENGSEGNEPRTNDNDMLLAPNSELPSIDNLKNINNWYDENSINKETMKSIEHQYHSIGSVNLLDDQITNINVSNNEMDGNNSKSFGLVKKESILKNNEINKKNKNVGSHTHDNNSINGNEHFMDMLIRPMKNQNMDYGHPLDVSNNESGDSILSTDKSKICENYNNVKMVSHQNMQEYNDKAGRKLLYLIKGLSNEEKKDELGKKYSQDIHYDKQIVGSNNGICKMKNSLSDDKTNLFPKEITGKTGGEAIMNLLGLNKNNDQKEERDDMSMLDMGRNIRMVDNEFVSIGEKDNNDNDEDDNDEIKSVRDRIKKSKNGKNSNSNNSASICHFNENEISERDILINNMMKNGNLNNSYNNINMKKLNYQKRESIEMHEQNKEYMLNNEHPCNNNNKNMYAYYKNMYNDNESNNKKLDDNELIENNYYNKDINILCNNNQDEKAMTNALLDIMKLASNKAMNDQQKSNFKNNESHTVNNTNKPIHNNYINSYDVLLKMQNSMENEDNMTNSIMNRIPNTNSYAYNNNLMNKHENKQYNSKHENYGDHNNIDDFKNKNIILNKNTVYNVIKETLQSEEFINLIWENLLKSAKFT